MEFGSTKTVNALQSFVAAVAMAFVLAGCGGGGSSGGTSGGSGGGGGTPPPSVSLVSISVTPFFPANLPKGLTRQFSATGFYSNGTTQNLTASVAWSSTAGTVASVNASGLATGVGVGTTNINALASGVSSASVALTVIPAVLQSIAITPANPTIGAGQSPQFTATGTYSDSTTQNITASVWWTSSNLSVATINSNLSTTPGSAFGASTGSSTIIATDPTTSVTSSTLLTVANYSVGGTQSLLPAGASVTVLNNGTDSLTFTNSTVSPTSSVPFYFNIPLATGATYNVTVSTQPTGGVHPCNVVDGSGTIAATYITSVQVVCATAVSTFAGTATVSGSTNGTGTAAKFNNPAGVVFDATSGNVYVADTNNNLIRKITSSGVVSTLAGSGAVGSANGTGAAASFSGPMSVAVDASGNVYVADTGNNLIRKITPAGVVTTWAGSGAAGTTNATGTSASFHTPSGVAVDSTGNVYVGDSVNNLIRKISPTQVVTTFAGTGAVGSVNGASASASFNYPLGVAVDTAGNVYVADYYNSLIRKISAGTVTTFAGAMGNMGYADGPASSAWFNYPADIVVDSSGNVYVGDSSNHLIRKIAAGNVTTYAGLTHYSGSSGGSSGFHDGPAWIDTSILSSSFFYPKGITIDAAGNLYVADQWNHLIRKIMP